MTVHELVEALQKLPPECYGYEVRPLRGWTGDEEGKPLLDVEPDERLVWL